MVAGRTIGADDEECSLAALGDDAVGDHGCVFRATEVHRFGSDLNAFGGVAGLGENFNEELVVDEALSFAHLFDLVFAALCDSAALDDVFCAFVHVVVDFAGFAADFNLHDGLGWNDVAAFAGVELADVDAGHAGAVAGDAVELNECVAGCGHCVAACIRFNACVGWTAGVGDVELRSAEEAVRVDGEFSGLAHHGDVSSEEVVCVVYHSGGGHAGSAADAFFSRLEADLDLAAEGVDVVADPVGECKAGRSMGVVAAGVHEAWTGRDEAFLGRDMVCFGGFRYRNAVDVEADGERWTWTAGIENADAAGVSFHFVEKSLGNAVLLGEFNAFGDDLWIASEAVVRIDDLGAEKDFIAQSSKLFNDEGRCSEFAPSFFRNGVEMAANTNEFILILFYINHFAPLYGIKAGIAVRTPPWSVCVKLSLKIR